jgi:hypothetical protein
VPAEKPGEDHRASSFSESDSGNPTARAHYGLANLENPAENLLHLFVAVCSGFTLWRERAGLSAAQPAMPSG